MKPPLAFISYDVTLGEGDRSRLLDEIGSCAEPFSVDDWSLKRQAPRADWDRLMHSKIGRCDFMIVLVSEGMEHEPIEAEIMESKRCNVPFFGVYVGDAKAGVALPPGLPANRTIPFDWERIAMAVRQVTREGKHHTFV
jgi:hypothetical protein